MVSAEPLTPLRSDVNIGEHSQEALSINLKGLTPHGGWEVNASDVVVKGLEIDPHQSFNELVHASFSSSDDECQRSCTLGLVT